MFSVISCYCYLSSFTVAVNILPIWVCCCLNLVHRCSFSLQMANESILSLDSCRLLSSSSSATYVHICKKKYETFTFYLLWIDDVKVLHRKPNPTIVFILKGALIDCFIHFGQRKNLETRHWHIIHVFKAKMPKKCTGPSFSNVNIY